MEFRTLTQRVAETLGAPVPKSAEGRRIVREGTGARQMPWRRKSRAASKPTACSKCASKPVPSGAFAESTDPVGHETLPLQSRRLLRPSPTCSSLMTCRACARARLCRGRHRDGRAQPGLGQAGRRVAGAFGSRARRMRHIPLAPRDRQGLTFFPATTPKQIELGVRNGAPEAAAGGPGGAQDWTEHQVRHLRLRAATTSRGTDRRHHAALPFVLSAGGSTITAWTSCRSSTSGHTPIPIKELIGSGKTQITFDQAPLNKATRYAAEDADVTLRLWQRLKPRHLARTAVATDLRDAGPAADPGGRRHGARRRADRPRPALAALGRVRPAHGGGG